MKGVAAREWRAGCRRLLVVGPASHSSAQAVITQTLLEAAPERALQLAVAVGRRCSGWASGVLGVVDRWLSGPASHSGAQAVIANEAGSIRSRAWYNG